MDTVWLRPDDAARALGLSSRAIYKRIRRGTMEHRIVDGLLEVLCPGVEPSPNPVDTLARTTAAYVASSAANGAQVQTLSELLSRQLDAFTRFDNTVTAELRAARKGRAAAVVTVVLLIMLLAVGGWWHRDSLATAEASARGQLAAAEASAVDRVNNVRAEASADIAAAERKAAEASGRVSVLREELDAVRSAYAALEGEAHQLRSQVVAGGFAGWFAQTFGKPRQQGGGVALAP